MGIRVLHVEQEVIGDSTTAMESVLQADLERTSLLKELSQCQSESCATANIEKQSRITEIYSRLNAIEADKAPSRAATILHGLGFNTEMQVS